MATKYTKSMLEEAVNQSVSYAGVLRILGIRQAGGSQSWITTKIKDYQISTSHFTGCAHNKGKTSLNKKSTAQILVVLPEGSHRPKHSQLKRAMLDSGVKHECGVKDCPSPDPIWNGKQLTLDVDHIDGNWLNNRLDNLRFACPNCHSQQ